jgi:hypothetical protein
LFLRGRFTGNAEAFVGPLPEVEQSTSFRAKGAIGVAATPGCAWRHRFAACGAIRIARTTISPRLSCRAVTSISARES